VDEFDDVNIVVFPVKYGVKVGQDVQADLVDDLLHHRQFVAVVETSQLVSFGKIRHLLNNAPIVESEGQFEEIFIIVSVVNVEQFPVDVLVLGDIFEKIKLIFNSLSDATGS